MKKDDQLLTELKERVLHGGVEDVLLDILDDIPEEPALVLWQILIEIDTKDYEQIKEKIYLYGSLLGSKDVLGRHLFVRMIEMLRMCRKV